MPYPLHIVLVDVADFPEGVGHTTRLKTFLQCIKALGHDATLLLEHSNGSVDTSLLKPQGEFEGVPFSYILGDSTPLRGFKFFTHKLLAVRALIKKIKALHAQRGVDIVWFNQLAGHDIIPITMACKRLGIKTIQSYEDERMKEGGLKRKIILANQLLGDYWGAPMADHLLQISHYLLHKYDKITKGKVPSSIVPTIVDLRKWQKKDYSKQNPVFRMVYMGVFFGFDEVEKIMDAVRLLVKKGHNIRFELIGYNKHRPDYMATFQEKIVADSMQNHIEMRGFLPIADMREALLNADLLVAIRSNDPWSNTGLSTKISEYLASGSAVLCADVGDNTKYLTDGESAYIVPAGCTTELIADRIREAILDPARRIKIAQNGYEVAKQKFDVGAVNKTLGQIFESLTTR